MNNKIKIAIAGDHALGVERLKCLLKKNGFEVTITASNGAQLIMKIMNSSVIPDVCILDGIMPVMCGSETTKALKNRWPKMKIVAFTMDEFKGEQMIKLGASVFVSKISPEILPDVIKTLMDVD